MPQYKVSISPQAAQMLQEHIAFPAEVSKPAARAMKTRVMTAIRGLGEMPERYPLLQPQEFFAFPYRRMFVPNDYLVIYRVQGASVLVQYILDCRREYRWMAGDLYDELKVGLQEVEDGRVRPFDDAMTDLRKRRTDSSAGKK